MNFTKKIISTVIIATLMTNIVSCSAKDEDEVVLTSVRTMEATKNYINKTLSYTVQFQSNISENIISPMVGKVEKAYFEVGDYVNAGDVLFDLDKESLEDQVKQVEQQVKQAEIGVKNAEVAKNSVNGGSFESQVLQLEANLKSLESQLITTKESVKVAESSVENAKDGEQLAKDSYELLEQEYEKNKILFENGLKSQIEMDQIEMQLNGAKAEYSRASTGLLQAESALVQAQEGVKTLEDSIATTKETLQLTKGKITDENLSRASLGLEQAQSGLESAQLQYDIIKKTLDDASVKASISGVVNIKGVKEGEYISNTNLAYQILDKSKVFADVKVTDRVINNVNVGDLVDVEMSSKDGEILKGTVETISPFVDQTNTYTVKISLDNSDESILLGSFAKVTFVIEDNDDSIVVPREVVLKDENNDFVYVVEDGFAVKKVVETGIDNGNSIEVISGISEGDTIISEGQSYLYDGEQINIVE